MEYVIDLLESQKQQLERRLYDDKLMYTDRKAASLLLQQLAQLKRAIKYLKLKTTRR